MRSRYLLDTGRPTQAIYYYPPTRAATTSTSSSTIHQLILSIFARWNLL